MHNLLPDHAEQNMPSASICPLTDKLNGLFKFSSWLETLASILVLLFQSFFSEVFPVVELPAPLRKGFCPTLSNLPMCRQGESKEVNRRCSVTLAGEEPRQVCTKSKKEGQKLAVMHQICSLNAQPALLFPWLYLLVSAWLPFQLINHQPVSDTFN